MKVALKDTLTWLAWAFSLGGSLTWIRSKLVGHDERLIAVEGCLTTQDMEPRFLSKKEHDRICHKQQATLSEIKEHLEKTDLKVEAILLAVTRLDEKLK